jgi:hypothetical protein
MRKSTEEDDLHQVMREEQRRGRRSVEESIRKAKQALVKELLEEESEEVFLASIRALGLQEGSKSWRQALMAWRDAWRERGRGQRGRR